MALVTEVFGDGWEFRVGARKMIRDLCDTDLNGRPKAAAVTIQRFMGVTRDSSVMLFPAFELQLAVQKAVLGVPFWEAVAVRRRDLTQRGLFDIKNVVTLMNEGKARERSVVPLSDRHFVPYLAVYDHNTGSSLHPTRISPRQDNSSPAAHGGMNAAAVAMVGAAAATVFAPPSAPPLVSGSGGSSTYTGARRGSGTASGSGLQVLPQGSRVAPILLPTGTAGDGSHPGSRRPSVAEDAVLAATTLLQTAALAGKGPRHTYSESRYGQRSGGASGSHGPSSRASPTGSGAATPVTLPTSASRPTPGGGGHMGSRSAAGSALGVDPIASFGQPSGSPAPSRPSSAAAATAGPGSGLAVDPASLLGKSAAASLMFGTGGGLGKGPRAGAPRGVAAGASAAISASAAAAAVAGNDAAALMRLGRRMGAAAPR
jgi:hypothetical protein